MRVILCGMFGTSNTARKFSNMLLSGGIMDGFCSFYAQIHFYVNFVLPV